MASYFGEEEKRSFKVRRDIQCGEVDLKRGITLELHTRKVPGTALQELYTVADGWKIPLVSQGFPFLFEEKEDLAQEEFILEISTESCCLYAADSEGFRRGVYFLASQLGQGSGPYLKTGTHRRKQKIRNRISRSYYGPTHREPFNIDELMDDVDYYPAPYLNRLAREGINGLWLTVIFSEVTYSSIQSPDPFMEKRLAKLRKTIEKCAGYGIKIFAFCIEPQGFTGYSEFAEKNPVLKGITNWGYEMVGFCPSSTTAQLHLYEQTRNLFTNAPGLGGILDITSGEQISSCFHNPIPGFSCPRCSKLTPSQILNNMLSPMVRGMKEAAPEAEFISWFYQSSAQKECAPWIYESAAHVPEGVINLYNFESGIILKQQKLTLHGGDYWNSKTGPAHRFRKLAKRLQKEKVPCGAKLQISNGHELATVPVIPVPGLLYKKYKFLVEHHVETVMYCWYFGSFPGVMNRAALKLGSWDFRSSEKEFLMELAEEEWGEDAPAAAAAWNYFSRGYGHYPLSTDIQYNGPFHHGIAWPLYPEVQFHDLYATWQPYPVSGDSIGKCLGSFTLEEFEKQARLMAKTYRKGLDLFLPLREKYASDPGKSSEINYAHAVGLLLESAWHIGRFYLLRKRLYNGEHKVLREMASIIVREMENTTAMISLCRKEFFIGYHSESEDMKFTPEELEKRLEQLSKVLHEELPALRRRLKAGGSPGFPKRAFALNCRTGEVYEQKSFSWEMTGTKRTLTFKVKCRQLPGASADRLYFVFCDELYSSMPQVVTFSREGFMKNDNRFLHPEKIKFKKEKDFWYASFTIGREQLEPKPTFNVFRQSAENGETQIDSWYPDPGKISLGASQAVMHSAAMGRLAADLQVSGKKKS